jgi:hypothetical protein
MSKKQTKYKSTDFYQNLKKYLSRDELSNIGIRPNH